ncbi:hypothetical protein A4G26_28175 [Mycobacterium kansasii]|nr:hypothetical protein A4G26_28175 [Mycobacterium kansasii]
MFSPAPYVGDDGTGYRDGAKRRHLQRIEADKVLQAIGFRPNVEGYRAAHVAHGDGVGQSTPDNLIVEM